LKQSCNNCHKLAGISFVILASFFLLPFSSHAAYDNIIAFGDLGSFSNPANLSRLEKTTANGNSHLIIHNNAVSGMEILTDFGGPTFKEDNSYAQSIFNYETNFIFGNFGFGYQLIEEKDYASSGDTIRAMQDIHNNKQVSGETYDIRLSGYEQEMEYYRFYFSSPIETDIVDGLWVGTSINLINGFSYLGGNLTGLATQVDDTTTQFNFNVDANESEDNSNGTGYSIDFGGACDINEKLSVEILFENVFGSMTWNNIKNTTATGNSQNIIVDSGGSIINNPTISGTEKVKTLVKPMHFKSIWAADYKIQDDLSVLGIIEPYPDEIFYYLGTNWNLDNHLALKFGYCSKFDSLSCGINWEFLNLTISANNISLVEAKSLGAQFGITL